MFEDFQDDGCVDYSVRLAYRDVTQSSGQLEVCLLNRWMSLCAGVGGPAESQVVCRQLGFTAYEGTNAQPDIFVSPQLGMEQCFPELDTQCSGSESTLEQCLPRRRRKRIAENQNLVVHMRCLGMYFCIEQSY